MPVVKSNQGGNLITQDGCYFSLANQYLKRDIKSSYDCYIYCRESQYCTHYYFHGPDQLCAFYTKSSNTIISNPNPTIECGYYQSVVSTTTTTTTTTTITTTTTTTITTTTIFNGDNNCYFSADDYNQFDGSLNDCINRCRSTETCFSWAYSQQGYCNIYSYGSNPVKVNSEGDFCGYI